MTPNPDTPPLLEFPCRFPIKIMGAAHPEFTRTVLEVTRIHAPDFEESIWWCAKAAAAIIWRPPSPCAPPRASSWTICIALSAATPWSRWL